MFEDERTHTNEYLHRLFTYTLRIELSLLAVFVGEGKHQAEGTCTSLAFKPQTGFPTGVTGFVAALVLGCVLQRGYNVRGTVQSVSLR